MNAAIARNRSWLLPSLILGIVGPFLAATSAPGQIVTNGGFDANAASFSNWPGYFGGGGVNPSSAPGWTTTGSGINGSATSLTSSPFAPATNAPDFLFMQGDRTADQAITTTSGSDYLFSFEASARNGNTAGVTVYEDNTLPASLVLKGDVTGSWWLNTSSFQKYAFLFTGSGAQTIRFASSGTGDHTSNIDNVSVVAVGGPIVIPDGTMFFTETDGSTVAYDFQLNGANQTFFRRPGTATYTGNITTDGSGGFFTLTAIEDAGVNNVTFDGSTITLGSKTFKITGSTVDGESQAANTKVTLNNVALTTDANVDVGRGTLEISGNTSLTIGGQLRTGTGGDWSRFVMGAGTSVSAPGGVDFTANGVIASSLYLNGGTLTTPYIHGNNYSTQTHVVFNGTTVVASASNTDFLQINTNNSPPNNAALVASGGAIFDTNGYDITINTPLYDSGGGTLTKQGAGTLTLTAGNTYSGGTTISGGTLLVNNTSGSGTGTGPVTVNNGTLGGNGTIAGLLTVNSGTLAPGTSPGILTLAGGVTFTDGTFAVELNGTTVGSEYDQLLVTGGNVDLGLGVADLAITTGYSPSPNDLFWIINNTSTTSGLTTGHFQDLADEGSSLMVDGQRFYIYYEANFETGLFSGGNDVLLTTVPEPSTLAMLLGLGGFALLGYLRHRRRSSVA